MTPIITSIRKFPLDGSSNGMGVAGHGSCQTNEGTVESEGGEGREYHGLLSQSPDGWPSYLLCKEILEYISLTWSFGRNKGKEVWS